MHILNFDHGTIREGASQKISRVLENKCLLRNFETGQPKQFHYLSCGVSTPQWQSDECTCTVAETANKHFMALDERNCIIFDSFLMLFLCWLHCKWYFLVDNWKTKCVPKAKQQIPLAQNAILEATIIINKIFRMQCFLLSSDFTALTIHPVLWSSI